MATTMAIADLARSSPNFGPTAIIPSPLDPRLLWTLAPAVAKAAMDSGMYSIGYYGEYTVSLVYLVHMIVVLNFMIIILVVGVARVQLDIDDYTRKLQEEVEMKEAGRGAY